ncbi:MAG: hypothetical protein WA160_07500 [Pseudobdellovibrio sp.]
MNIKWPGDDKRGLGLYRAISVLLKGNQELIQFLFDPEKPRLRRRAGILRDDAWNFSEEDQLLLRVALDLWSGSGHVSLWELIELWDESDWTRFNAAILEIATENTCNFQQRKS